jgi:GlpG protein
LVTILACGLMILLFIGWSSGYLDLRWLYATPGGIWAGRHWTLITSQFLHLHLWHLGLNVAAFVYWARPVEQLIGPWRMALLLTSSAFVSSVAQLAMFDSAGIGASGMAYAVFGFGWLVRAQNPALRTMFTMKAMVVAMTWLVAGFLVFTREIGNGAHIGGLVFGVLIAEVFVRRRRPRLAKTGLAIVCVVSIVLAFFCPWSGNWWAAMGYLVHRRGAYGLAAELYRNSLRLSANNNWVMTNLVLAEKAAGQDARANATLSRLKRLAPAAAAELEAEIRQSSQPDGGL